MAKKIKFVYADLKIAPYTGNITTDITNATTIGLLKDGIKINGDIQTKEIKPYAFSTKVFGRNEVDAPKITAIMIELNADSIARTGLFTKTGTAPNEKYILTNPNNEYVIIVEEKEVNTGDEKLGFVFYPCAFTGKLDLNYDNNNVELPVEYTVYADENSPEGLPGMYYYKVSEVQ